MNYEEIYDDNVIWWDQAIASLINNWIDNIAIFWVPVMN
jgi:hypothetical protein